MKQHIARFVSVVLLTLAFALGTLPLASATSDGAAKVASSPCVTPA